MDLKDFFSIPTGGLDSLAASPIPPYAAVARLREAAARFAEQQRGPRFRVGDLVTPVSDGNVKGAGAPHIVVSITDGSAENDLRVLYFCFDTIVSKQLPSREFELWSAPETGAADAD